MAEVGLDKRLGGYRPQVGKLACGLLKVVGPVLDQSSEIPDLDDPIFR